MGSLRGIVVGGRDFDIAGGPPNVHIVVYIHRIYQWYIRYVYSIHGGPCQDKKPKMTPANNYAGAWLLLNIKLLKDLKMVDRLPYRGAI